MTKTIYSVTISDNPQEMIGLSSRIEAKHILDSVDSPLLVIDMADFSAKLVSAKAADLLVFQYNGAKEIAFEARDVALGINANVHGTVDYYVKAARDILVGVHKNYEHLLNEWGYDVLSSAGKYRINIPQNAEQMITLGKRILEKHTELGVNSPIIKLNIVDFTAKTTLADEQHIIATTKQREKENITKERNYLLGISPDQSLTSEKTLRFYIISIRDILLGIYKSNVSELGLWGFDVQYGPSTPSGKKSLTGVVKDTAGVVISGAVLTLTEIASSVNSGSTGVYSFYKQPAGTYTLQVVKSGYITQNNPNVVIVAGSTTNFNIKMLEAGGSLIVNVYSEGLPLADASVKIMETGVIQITGPTGTVSFTSLPPADYNIEVTAPGKAPQILPVVIVNGVTEMLSLNMLPE